MIMGSQITKRKLAVGVGVIVGVDVKVAVGVGVLVGVDVKVAVGV